MNARIDAISPGRSAQAAAVANTPAKKPVAHTPPPARAAARPAPQVTPAATVQVTSVPASVPADDRAAYLQILKANGGNADAALAAIKAMEAKKANG